MLKDKERIEATIRQLVSWLVAGDFSAIERYTRGLRLSSQLLQEAVSTYGHKLVMPPASAFDGIDTIQVTGATPKRWSVRFDLWTEDEGRSDLSLECTLIDGDKELLEAEVDNLHVL
jgi:hypothetical protein